LARILLIDDNPAVLRVLHNLFLAEGHSVEDAPDSATGVMKHHEHPFDLIITDIVMPEKEGISTIIELRHEYRDLKIIAMSGGGEFEPYGYLDIARRVGADRTIAKPFSAKEIMEVVNDVLYVKKNGNAGT
jgi:CheY-like chemotaxis protein